MRTYIHKLLTTSPGLRPPSPPLRRRGKGEAVVRFARAKKLRRPMTPHEEKLWHYLRAKRFHGFKFRRQNPIGHYIVDFSCPSKKLIIELDGGGHMQEEQKAYDKRRDTYLKKLGYKVLRVWNNEVYENLNGVFHRIYELIQ